MNEKALRTLEYHKIIDRSCATQTARQQSSVVKINTYDISCRYRNSTETDCGCTKPHFQKKEVFLF